MEKRLFWGMASGAGSIAVRTLLNLLLIPVLVRTMGMEYFGLYMLLAAILEIGIMLDLGVTSALVRLLGRYVVVDSPSSQARKETYLKVGHGFYAGLGLLFLLAGMTFLPSFPLLFNVQEELAGLARLALLLVLMESAIAIYSSHFRAVLLSRCQHQWTNVADTVYYVLGMGVGLCLVMAGFGLPGLLLARLGAAILAVAFMAYRACRIEPATLWQKARFRFSALREVLRLGGHAFAVNLSVLVSHKIDAFVIAHFLTLTAVGVYEIVFRLLGVTVQIGLKLAEGVLPMFSQFSAENRRGEARDVFLRMSALLNIVAVLLLTLLAGCYPALFGVIAERNMSMSATWPVLALAVPILWSGVLQMPANYFLYASGRHAYLTKSSLLAAGANLVLSLLLVKPLGLVGVALGTMIPQLVQHQASLIRETCRELDISFKTYVTAVHRPALLPWLATLLWLSICWPMLGLVKSDVQVLAACMVVGLVGLLLGMGLWFARTATREERVFVRNLGDALLWRFRLRARVYSDKSREGNLLWRKNKLRVAR